VNQSEEYLARLCRRSFLSLWSYPTPQGKNAGKELCDCLVVCDPDVIIFSVKLDLSCAPFLHRRRGP
jgi:hypothetical protein